MNEMKKIIRENLWFLFPFILWFIAGAILMLCYPLNDLFLFVNSHHSPLFDRLMTCFSAYGRGDVIPFILVPILILPAYRNRTYVLSAVLYGLLIPTIIFLAKEYFDTPRPLLCFEKGEVHTVPWLQDLNNNSFPSGHTFAAFGLFTLLSILLPASQKRWSLLFFILASLCGYSRMYLGQHFFQDVYAGSILGVLFTALIYVRVLMFKTRPSS